MAVSKAEFFEIAARPLKETVVSIAGKEYKLRELSEDAGAEYEAAMYDAKGKFILKNARKALIAKMLIDDEGNYIVDDVAQLATMPRSLAGALYSECLKLNSFEESEIKDIIKNSEGVEGNE